MIFYVQDDWDRFGMDHAHCMAGGIALIAEGDNAKAGAGGPGITVAPRREV
jgi:hypothetical protein